MQINESSIKKHKKCVKFIKLFKNFLLKYYKIFYSVFKALNDLHIY